MTIQTSREAAEALWLSLNNILVLGSKEDFLSKCEAAFAARDRTLLAEDEATIEAMAKVVCEQNGYTRVTDRERGLCRDWLTALRRNRGVEP